MEPFFRHSIFGVIPVLRSSHTKPKSNKIGPTSAALSQTHMIALEVPTNGGKTAPNELPLPLAPYNYPKGSLHTSYWLPNNGGDTGGAGSHRIETCNPQRTWRRGEGGRALEEQGRE